MRRAAIILLSCAILAGGALRFRRLSEVPPALYCDEAFQGYEAYSILATGADSRGVRTPVFFDIFGVGWQEPLYVYLTVLPVRLLGMTATAVRAVAACSGTLALAAVAWLAWCLGRWRPAAAAACVMAVSPWAFHFSRVGFQASLLPLFLAAGAAALLRGAARADDEGPAGTLWLAAGCAILSAALYTYVAARAMVPLILIGFAVTHAGLLRRRGLRMLALPAVVAIVLALPVARFSVTAEGLERYSDVGLAGRYEGAAAVGKFAGNYLSYFSPGFLLSEGDPNPRHSVEGFGMLLPHGAVFLLAGLAVALVRRTPADLFLVWWLLVAPLPGAIAADARHAIRAIGILPALYALAGSGAAAIFGPGSPLDPARRRGKAVLIVVAAAAILSAGLYVQRYFGEYPIWSAPSWEYGLKEAYRAAGELSGGHDEVYVTKLEDFPYIQYLFFTAYPPELYQKEKLAGSKFVFDAPVFPRPGARSGRLPPMYVLKPRELPPTGFTVERTILYPDGSPAFVVAR